MQTISLSGFIDCQYCEERSLRAELLQILFKNGWNIQNANGDKRITLGNIEKRIIEADAFLFNPDPSIEEMFHLVSVFVGYQTLDPDLEGKPSVLLNPAGSWDTLLAVLDQLHKNGTIHQDHRKFLLQVNEADEVLPTLKKAQASENPDAGREKIHAPLSADAPTANTPAPKDLIGNVCVFCSASIKDEAQLQAGYDLGRLLAENKLGCVSGAGCTGIMGTVVQGSVEAGGWTAGSNVPHIIELEGLPEGLSAFWPRPDIYTRMEVMIEHSDAFVIMPGGAGTVQELLALLLFRSQKDPLMEGKPIIVFNPDMGGGEGFWDSLIDLLKSHGRSGSCHFVDQLDQVVPSVLDQLRK